MADVSISKEISLDELSSFLQNEMTDQKVYAGPSIVWVVDNSFQACRVRPKITDSGTKLIVMGDMTTKGRIALIAGLLLLGLMIFAFTETILVPGALVFIGIFVVRFLPSKSLERRVRSTLEKLTDHSRLQSTTE